MWARIYERGQGLTLRIDEMERRSELECRLRAHGVGPLVRQMLVAKRPQMLLRATHGGCRSEGETESGPENRLNGGQRGWGEELQKSEWGGGSAVSAIDDDNSDEPSSRGDCVRKWRSACAGEPLGRPHLPGRLMPKTTPSCNAVRRENGSGESVRKSELHGCEEFATVVGTQVVLKRKDKRCLYDEAECDIYY